MRLPHSLMASNTSFTDDLECPACLLVPRGGPIPACPVGHLVCRLCRVNVTTCPTCRRPLSKNGYNVLASKLIEKIDHPCKFRQYGCNVKKMLNAIEEHESRCPERTIKCPRLSCQKEVQMRKFPDHAAVKLILRQSPRQTL